jgi:hypothetical protein
MHCRCSNNQADGALAQLYLATADVADLENGGFYYPIGKYKPTHEHPAAMDIELQAKLWTETKRMIAAAKPAEP